MKRATAWTIVSCALIFTGAWLIGSIARGEEETIIGAIGLCVVIFGAIWSGMLAGEK